MNTLLWVVALLVLGLAVMVLEVFVPSGGILGFVSILALISAVATAFLEQGTTAGMAALAVVVLAVPAVLSMAFRWFPDTPLGRRVLPPAGSGRTHRSHRERTPAMGQRGDRRRHRRSDERRRSARGRDRHRGGGCAGHGGRCPGPGAPGEAAGGSTAGGSRAILAPAAGRIVIPGKYGDRRRLGPLPDARDL